MADSRLYLQLSQLAAFNAEYNYVNSELIPWLLVNYDIPVLVVVIYLIVCLVGTKSMRFYRPLEIDFINILWNAMFCVFSFLGMCRTVFYLISVIVSTEPSLANDLLCNNGHLYNNSTSGFWVTAFMISKFPEFIDTALLILRKKSFNRVHIFHYILMVYYSWDSVAKNSPHFIYIVGINYAIQAIMYGYHILDAFHISKRYFSSNFIIIIQSIQLLSGLLVTGTAYVYSLNGITCGTPSNLVIGMILYSIQIYTFYYYSPYFNKVVYVKKVSTTQEVTFGDVKFYDVPTYYTRKEKWNKKKSD